MTHRYTLLYQGTLRIEACQVRLSLSKSISMNIGITLILSLSISLRLSLNAKSEFDASLSRRPVDVSELASESDAFAVALQASTLIGEWLARRFSSLE